MIGRRAFLAVTFGAGAVGAVEVVGHPPSSASLKEERKKAAEFSVRWTAITDPRVFNHPLLTENALIGWRMGYLSDGYQEGGGRRLGQERSGQFVIKSVRRIYGNDGGMGLEISAVDKGVRLATEAPKTWTNVLISTVAEEMAQAAGLKVRILDPGTVKHRSVVVGAGETWGAKLKQMADDEDMEFFVDGDTLVLQKAPRERTADVVVGYRVFDRRVMGGIFLEDFSTSADARANAGAKKRSTGGKGDDGEASTTTTEAKSGEKAGSRRLRATYITGGHRLSIEDSREPAKEQAADADPLKDKEHRDARAAAQAKFLGWKGEKCGGKLHGFMLEPRQTLQVVGVAAKDGVPWMIQSVSTEYSEAGDLVVSFSGNTDPEKRGKAKGDGGDGQGTTAAAAAAKAKANRRLTATYTSGGGHRLTINSGAP